MFTSGLLSLDVMVAVVAVLGVGGLCILVWREWSRSAPPAAPQTEFEAAAERLDKEAGAVLGLMRSYEDAGERYSGSLARAGQSLPKSESPGQVAAIVKFLLAENAKMQHETRELKKNLEQSKAQIDKLRSHLAEAHEVGMRDHLTSLRNRRCFDDCLATELANARTRSTPLCLVMADIDDFKKVNDLFGHQTGDEILKTFARIIADNVRPGDTVARYGGEEFAMILPATRVEKAGQLTEQIRSQLESMQLPAKAGKQIPRITASFGIAEFDAGDDADALVQRSDLKLYRAKCEGKNRVAADRMAAA